jgi:predicted ATPase
VLDFDTYEFALEPTPDNRLIFSGASAGDPAFRGLDGLLGPRMAPGLRDVMFKWAIYHFQDTSLTANVRRQRPINHDEVLHEDAGNLAALLCRIRTTDPRAYSEIRDAVRMAAPFFDDFKLRPVPTNPDLIQLEWLQKGTDYPFLAHQLSDGTLRFICLATALLQPDAPPLMLFDEPELGLHPYALTLLASLFSQAADASRQIIVSTQSAQLLNEFRPEDVIVVERANGESIFRRLNEAELSEWLKEYSLGELWQKNVLGGGPRPEDHPS